MKWQMLLEAFKTMGGDTTSLVAPKKVRANCWDILMTQIEDVEAITDNIGSRRSF